MLLRPIIAAFATVTLGLTAYVGVLLHNTRTATVSRATLAQESATVAPAPEPTDGTSCAAAGRIWCPSTTGGTGYCASTGGSCPPPPPPPSTPSPESCKTQSQYYCTSSAGGSGWCSSSPCTQSDCTAAGKKWCNPMPGTAGSGWCTESSTSCPAYTASDCTAQGGNWCTDSYSSSGGWCQTGGGSCPHTCPSGQYWNGTACVSSTPTPTPGPTPESCKAQNMEYCPASSGGTGTCVSPGNCVITTPGATQCSDNKDNDGDGMVDFPADTGCYGKEDNDEAYAPPIPTPGTTQCSDGKDNDGDGKTDYPADTSCYGKEDDDEAYPPGGVCSAFTQASCTADPACEWNNGCQSKAGVGCKYFSQAACDADSACKWTSSTGCGSNWQPPSPTTCPGIGQSADMKYYCASTGGYGGGWCSSTPCTQSECTAAGKQWCDPAPATPSTVAYTPSPQGWCQEKTYNCPAYTAAACQTQGGNWCQPSSGMGWCATGGATCPNENKEKQECLSRKGAWCVSAGGGYGWCAAEGTKCPAYTEGECSVQGGKWCKNAPSSYTSTVSGWCSTGSYASCPIYTAEECAAQAGSWCVSKYGGSPWCAQGGSKCPDDSTVTKPPDDKKIPICPAAPYLPCPKGHKEAFEKNADGCPIQRCIPPEGEIVPDICPSVMPPACPGGTLEVSKKATRCPFYECRARECPLPPPSAQCASGWIPRYGKGLDCPFYECQSTEHSEMETCVRVAVGEAYFEQMKRGTLSEAIMKSLFGKIEAAGCFKKNVPPGPPPITPEPPKECPLDSMKRQMTDGMTRELERLDKEVDKKFRSAGIPVPASYEIVVTKIKAILASAGNVKDCAELFTLGRDLPELMRELHDQVAGIEHIAQAGEVLKRLQREIGRIERDWKRIARRLQTDTRTELEAEFTSRVTAASAAIEVARSATQSGDPDRIEHGTRQAFAAVEDLHRTLETGQMSHKLARYTRLVRGEIKAAERVAKRLFKDGEEVTDVYETIDAVKEVLAEVDKARIQCTRNPDETCLDLFERFNAARDDLKDALAEATGVGGYEDFAGVGGLGKHIGGFGKVLDFFEGR